MHLAQVSSQAGPGFEYTDDMADIFSLGCVFLEMCTILMGRSTTEFSEFRANGGATGSDAFHLSLPAAAAWLDQLRHQMQQKQHFEELLEQVRGGQNADPLLKNQECEKIREAYQAEDSTRAQLCAASGAGCGDSGGC